jgi:hypothetical protein
MELDPVLVALKAPPADEDEVNVGLEVGDIGVLAGDAFEVLKLGVLVLEAVELEPAPAVVVVGRPPTRLVGLRLKVHHSSKMPAALVASAVFEQLRNAQE